MKLNGIIFSLCSLSFTVNANTCEKNFASFGDPRNGAEFSTSADIAGVTPHSAIGQLRGIAAKDGFNVLNETSDTKTGALTIEQTRGVKYPFLIYFTANAKTNATEVSVKTRLNKRVTAKPEDIRQGMCGMLARVKSGKEGEALAAKARADAPAAKVTEVKAITLAREFDRIVRKHTPEVITERYKGKAYKLDGQVQTSLEDDGNLEIWYDVFREGNSLMPAEWGSEMTRTQIVCRLAPDQIKQGRMLVKDDWARLTGTVSHFHQGTPNKLIFTNCKFI